MSSQSVVLLIMGVSGSGKSLIGAMLAERLDYKFADADQYHTSDNKEKMRKGLSLSDMDRMPWLLSLAQVVNGWLSCGQSGVIACSALKQKYREIILAKANNKYVLYLKGDYDLIAERLKYREHEFMNANLLFSQFQDLEEPENAIYLDAKLVPEEIVQCAISAINQQLSD